MDEPLRVTFYTRAGCLLCDKALEQLNALQTEIPFELVTVDIEVDEALLARYMDQIPVVEAGAYQLKAPFDATDLRVTLMAARENPAPRKRASERQRGWVVLLNRLVLWVSKHWLALANLLLALYLGLPFAAPALMKAGAVGPARLIYTMYSPLCHQLAFRSWFLFGPQPAYPRALAGTRLPSFEEMTGIPADDFWSARAFVGDERLGYKVALCERDVAIYGGMLLGGLVFALLRRRMRPLPLWAWFLVGILPMALDGGTQLISMWPGYPLGPRESTPFLRTLTGGLFGVANAWLAFPYLEESMADLRAMVAAKLAGARLLASPRAD